MKVRIPSASRRDYTRRGEVEVEGATLGVLLADPDRRYPGIRFREVDEKDHLRRRVRVFVDDRLVHDLTHPLDVSDEVFPVQALSGDALGITARESR